MRSLNVPLNPDSIQWKKAPVTTIIKVVSFSLMLSGRKGFLGACRFRLLDGKTKGLIHQ
jgi:hypothetical protein